MVPTSPTTSLSEVRAFWIHRSFVPRCHTRVEGGFLGCGRMAYSHPHAHSTRTRAHRVLVRKGGVRSPARERSMK